MNSDLAISNFQIIDPRDKETYKIYNKDYSDPMLKVKKNKKSLLKKFKSLF